ncbi:MAG: hypothetical protein AAF548_11160 [Actinomycetota bacterium]
MSTRGPHVAIALVLCVVALAAAWVALGPEPEPPVIGIPIGDQALEIPVGDGDVVERAWAVDPIHVFGDDVPGDLEEPPTTVHVDVGGFDAVVVYGLYPNCAFAPALDARLVDGAATVVIESRGSCKAPSLRAMRAVALDLAAEVDPSLLVATHHGP